MKAFGPHTAPTSDCAHVPLSEGRDVRLELLLSPRSLHFREILPNLRHGTSHFGVYMNVCMRYFSTVRIEEQTFDCFCERQTDSPTVNHDATNKADSENPSVSMLVKNRKNLFLRNTKILALALELFILYCGLPRGYLGCHGQAAHAGGRSG